MTPNRLRTKVALTFGTLSLIVAVLVAIIAYQLVLSYLSAQREQVAVNGTLLDAGGVINRADSSASPSDALGAIAATGSVQRLLLVNDTWYAGGVSVSPDDLPRSLLEQTAASGAAMQRFAIGDTVYLAVAVRAERGTLVEIFPLAELVRTTDLLRISLLVGVLLAAGLGAVVGWFAAKRLLRPLRQLATTAGAFGKGDFGQRMGTTGDADLDPIAEAFDDMADAVQDRIERERRFVANVSHELRTPVTVALGTVEILDGRKDALPESSARLFAVLTQQVTRLAHIVMDLIELGTLTPGTKPRWERVDVVDICDQVLRDRGLDQGLMTHHGDTETTTDPGRLERIVSNLVDNAELHGSGLTGLDVERDGDAVVVSVRDSGEGIPESDRARVFELFHRGLEAKPGTGSGLGLTIVGEQAELIGASVSVGDASGGGACFRVSIPVQSDDHPADAGGAL